MEGKGRAPEAVLRPLREEGIVVEVREAGELRVPVGAAGG